MFEETIADFEVPYCYLNYLLLLSIIRIITLPLYIAWYTLFVRKPMKNQDIWHSISSQAVICLFLSPSAAKGK